MAWPAAPLTMLSMAEMAMKVPVRPSTNRDTSQKLLVRTFFTLAT